MSDVCGVVGHEYDIRISNPQMANVPPEDPPPGATIPPEPSHIQTLAQALVSPTSTSPLPTVFDYFARWIGDTSPPLPPLLTAEMIYWERPAGGQVFNAGSIGSGWALSYDPVMQKVMLNVLSLFGVQPSSGKSVKQTKVSGKSTSKRPSKKSA